MEMNDELPVCQWTGCKWCESIELKFTHLRVGVTFVSFPYTTIADLEHGVIVTFDCLETLHNSVENREQILDVSALPDVCWCTRRRVPKPDLPSLIPAEYCWPFHHRFHFRLETCEVSFTNFKGSHH